MILHAGDIVLIPDAPFTNRLAVKPRPCLVISGQQFNQSGPDVILAPLTSNVRHGDPKQVVIESSKASFVDTGLKQTSAIKCGAIFAYSQTQIRRKLGFIQQQTLNYVRKKVIDILTTD
jgi:mRNA-degrading endonuclease toxin of MazEF toxin-antitoxin module